MGWFMADWAVEDTTVGGRPGIGWPAAWGRDLAVAVIIGAWIGALGPFGNYGAGPLAARIAFHLVVAAVGVLAFGAATRWAVRAGRNVGLSPLVSAPVAIFATCLPMSGVAALVGVAFFPQLAHLVSPVDWGVETLVLIFPIVCGYAALLHLLAHGRSPASVRVGPTTSDAPVQTDRSQVATQRRLARPGEILALKVEDHYVRIYTAAGSSLMLMRLSDAMAEMDGVEGLRVHRSWWVSRRAVVDLQLDGRGGRLVLSNGLHVPIARSTLGHVRAAGWTRSGEGGA
jgi:hypothetical protein